MLGGLFAGLFALTSYVIDGFSNSIEALTIETS